VTNAFTSNNFTHLRHFRETHKLGYVVNSYVMPC